MIIVFTNEAFIKPNNNFNKSESLIVLEGKIDLYLLDENGKVYEKILMSEYNSSNIFSYRLKKSCWHTMESLTPYSVVHEFIEGPFDNTFIDEPTWMPKNKTDMKTLLVNYNKE